MYLSESNQSDQISWDWYQILKKWFKIISYTSIDYCTIYTHHTLFHTCTVFWKASILSCSGFNKFGLPEVFFVKTQRIRNKPSNFTNFLLYNQIILHKRGGNQSSGSTKSLHWLISFAACSLISGQHGRLNNFCSNMLKIMFFCTFRLYHEN